MALRRLRSREDCPEAIGELQEEDFRRAATALSKHRGQG